MEPHRWNAPHYKSFLLSIVIATSCLSSLQTYALDWVIVTSEADSGPGTLRDAINTVNNGSSIENAIGFANNIHTIFLESNLPIVANPVLIDGIAVVESGSTIEEGNCDLLPLPTDNPKGFSAGIRITIDGSLVPDTVDPDARWGLRTETSDITIRGIAITNIAAPGNGSYAAGISSEIDTINNNQLTVECCEISNIQNNALTTTMPLTENKAIGIHAQSEEETTLCTVSKCYIHNIEGGSIIDCDELGLDTALQSGNGYGILYDITTIHVDASRIECIASGSISTLCTDTSRLRATVGQSAGIADTIAPVWPCGFEPERNRMATQNTIKNCPVECNEECEESSVCIKNNIICSILGGLVNSTQQEIFVTETAGILIGSPNVRATISEKNGLIIEKNTIHNVLSGTIYSSSDQAIVIAMGSYGIIATPLGAEIGTSSIGNLLINCNTITTIKNGSLSIDGQESRAFSGNAYGIWSLLSEGDTFIECNTISSISGATATAEGICSSIAATIDSACGIGPARHTPGGQQCALSEAPTVAGIRSEVTTEQSLSANVNNNQIHTVHGGKQTARGTQSSVLSLGTAGIYVQSVGGITSNQNTVSLITGTELHAKLGSLSAIKQDGTTGLCLISPTVTATENHIEEVREGAINTAHNTLGINLTYLFSGLTKSAPLFVKSEPLEIDTALPYAPVITSGIVASSIEVEAFSARNCMNQAPWCIANNTVKAIAGSTVSGGLQPLGSIATGIWLQPIKSTAINRAPSFESCTFNRQIGVLNGVACNNNIHTITSGTSAPSYGIFLDGSTQFFLSASLKESSFFTLDHNTITNIHGSKTLPTFNVNLSAILGLCPGSDNQQNTAFPFFPFEPTSGIYTLFGGCSTVSNNTITHVKDASKDARGLTTAASSDMLITNNSCSHIKGYGIFVGGVIATIDIAGEFGTDPNDLTFESFASVRNKIHTNSTFNNTNIGIKLGLIDWSNALFGIEDLNVCPGEIGPEIDLIKKQALKKETLIPEDSVAIVGNHGQIKPCIVKVTCNTNSTVTIDLRLQNTHRLTNFTVQFFRNSTNLILQGEQAISDFSDQQFVFTTDFYGNAHKQFTFIPLAPISSSDTITAHVTVSDLVQSAVSDTFFCDTSEFGGQTLSPCPPVILKSKSKQ